MKHAKNNARDNARNSAMNSSKDILLHLRRLKPIIQQQFNVEKIAIFGSWVRGEQKFGSDLDVWVHFNGSVKARQFFGLQFFLEDELNLPIDLVSDKAMRPELRSYIEKEAVNVYDEPN